MIAKLERPSSYNLMMLRRWLDHSSYGNSFLYGLEKHAWDENYKHDLVSLPRSDTQTNKDLLSRLFFGSFPNHYHKLIGRHYKVSYPHIFPVKACSLGFANRDHYETSIDRMIYKRMADATTCRKRHLATPQETIQ